MPDFTLAAKCRPNALLFDRVAQAGINGMELYLSSSIIERPKEIVRLCSRFSFKYAVHAPNDCHAPKTVRDIAAAIGAPVCVYHDIFWEDEWRETIAAFEGSGVKICVENIMGIHEPAKFERRYQTGRCLDLEHLQMECGGVYEDEFIPWIRQASHIHLTGYSAGSSLWHTHLHFDPHHSAYLLSLIEKAGYSGLVVSEARVATQSEQDFRDLADFFNNREQFL
ncbi:MAG: TIM barrel protein [Elusimicrobiaceae bacterium]|nr:TIM barrel protein [Elusimicrobiaceae bacterium]